jgi:hypothetical protein
MRVDFKKEDEADADAMKRGRCRWDADLDWHICSIEPSARRAEAWFVVLRDVDGEPDEIPGGAAQYPSLAD